MKAQVVYDSLHGNTAQIAEAMAEALGSRGQAALVKVGAAELDQIEGLGLLIVGSPTRGFRPTPQTTAFLKSIPAGALNGVRVAAFDTRFTEAEIDKVRILAFFVRLFGYAASKIASRLEKKGGVLAAPPEGFYVGGTEGPLLEGERERAAAWALGLG